MGLLLGGEDSVPEYLELLAGLLAQLAVRIYELRMNGPDVVLEAGIAAEQALTEDTFKGLELHVNALRVIF